MGALLDAHSITGGSEFGLVHCFFFFFVCVYVRRDVASLNVDGGKKEWNSGARRNTLEFFTVHRISP